jgi:hypothetical protein
VLCGYVVRLVKTCKEKKIVGVSAPLPMFWSEYQTLLTVPSRCVHWLMGVLAETLTQIHANHAEEAMQLVRFIVDSERLSSMPPPRVRHTLADDHSSLMSSSAAGSEAPVFDALHEDEVPPDEESAFANTMDMDNMDPDDDRRGDD